jgi:hypothetical protein
VVRSESTNRHKQQQQQKTTTTTISPKTNEHRTNILKSPNQTAPTPFLFIKLIIFHHTSHKNKIFAVAALKNEIIMLLISHYIKYNISRFMFNHQLISFKNGRQQSAISFIFSPLFFETSFRTSYSS